MLVDPGMTQFEIQMSRIEVIRPAQTAFMIKPIYLLRILKSQIVKIWLSFIMLLPES